MPADPSLNQEIVLHRPETADLAERNPKTGCTNTRAFRQDFTEIAFAESVAAEFRKSPLLSSKPPDPGRHYRR